MSAARRLPLWLKLAYAIAVPTIALCYWHEYGPSNFLWLSEIALACTALAVLMENRLLASMSALVLLFEMVWATDFLAGGHLIGGTAYMFDSHLPLYLRGLSLFHLALPPTLLFLLYRLGYDVRAFWYQTIVTWIALVLSFLLSDSARNINWVHGLGRQPQQFLPPVAYVGLQMVVLPLLVFLPTHVVLRRSFPVTDKH
jgi:hypothetical protein